MTTDERLRPDTFWLRLRRALDRVPDDAKRPPPEARVGAVLVLLEETEDGPRVVLTRRRQDLRSHPGQVSFPGGRLDPGETLEEAALREAWEEIGLDAASVEVVGTGPTFYIPPSRFWVVPVLGRWNAPHELTENPWEVDAVLQVPLTDLLDRRRWRHAPLTLRGSTWAWQLDEDLLWGATAVVMSLLLDVAVEGWNDGLSPQDLGEDLAVRPWEQAPSWQRRARLEGELPEVAQDAVLHVTAAQMRALDDHLGDVGLPLTSMVEHAGRALAQATRRLLDGSLSDVRVTVLAGTGGNGAGGLAAARLLDAAGAAVRVLLTGEPRLAQQRQILEAGGVPVEPVLAPDDVDEPSDLLGSPGDVVLDAMVGYAARPPLRGTPELLADWLRRHDVPVIALDLPSGIGADEGLRGSCVTADVTVTLAAPKVAFRERIVHPYVGDLYLADLGIPPAAWRAVGLEPPLVFDRGPLVRLTIEAAAPDAGTTDQASLSGPAAG